MSGARQLNVRYFTKFILVNVFSLIETICSKTWENPLQKSTSVITPTWTTT